MTQLRFYGKYLLIGLVVGVLIGFFVGRSTINSGEPKDVKGKTITGTAYIPIPYVMKLPGEIEYIPVYKKDPNGVPTSEIDTAKSKDATVYDWNLERKYASTLFNNENGKFSYDISVQNNKLSNFEYTFTPIHKQLPPKEKVFQPFVSASYSTFNYIGVGGGIFYHDIGFEYQYQQKLSGNTGHSFSIKFKF